MNCPYCGGRGWAWYGIASNAERVPCEPCAGAGRGRADWGPLGGLVIVLFSVVVCAGLLLWGVMAVFGATAGEMTLKEFRALPEPTRTALVAGAMAATEHLGLRCPAPQLTVVEYASALTWRRLDEQIPWVDQFIRLAVQQGCQVSDKQAHNDLEEGA